MKIGFIGLGNVGGKLAGSLLRNDWDLTVRDLDKSVAQPFLDKGAKWAESPKQMAEEVDILVTCLPSPAASAAVMEAEDGALGFSFVMESYRRQGIANSLSYYRNSQN